MGDKKPKGALIQMTFKICFRIQRLKLGRIIHLGVISFSFQAICDEKKVFPFEDFNVEDKASQDREVYCLENFFSLINP